MASKLTVDNTNVYLHIEDLTECCFELWEVDGKKDSAVKVRISIDDWKSMIKHWKKANKQKKQMKS